MKEFLKQKQPHEFLWVLLSLQEMLRSKGEVSQELAWFKEVDLAVNSDNSYIEGKRATEWKELQYLAPAGLKIPEVAKLYLVRELNK
jgi:hypothetical protein